MDKARVFTVEEVAKHHTADDIWMIHSGRVYDVTEFCRDHPGGTDLLCMYAGGDVKDAMDDEMEHKHSLGAYEIMKEYQIGVLDNVEQHPVSVVEGEASPKFLDITKPLWSQMWKNNFTREFYVQQVHIPHHTKDGSSAPIFGNSLEFLTLNSWYIIPMIWLPVTAWWISIAYTVYSPLSIAAMFLAGVFHWTIVEYCIHRFVFHVDDNMIEHWFAYFIHFFAHGVHHFLPMDGKRLVMPPALFTSLMVPVFSFYNLFFSTEFCCGVGSGTLFSYVCYDMVHYYVHHGRPKNGYLQMMKTYHLNHHYMDFSKGFGITNKFWDEVMGTDLVYPVKHKAA